MIVFLWDEKLGPQSCNLSLHWQHVWIVCLTFSLSLSMLTFSLLSKKEKQLVNF